MPDSTTLKIHGGKKYLADWIVSKMAPHLTYCEPYAGGLSVLFARDPIDERLWLAPHKGVSEIVNDLNRDLSNFWKVLQGGDSFASFQRICEATPFSGLEYHDAALELEEYPEPDETYFKEFSDPIVRAWKFFVVNRQSLAGRMQGFTGITRTRLRRGMNNEVSAWLSAIEGLPEAHDRLKRVLILPPQPALDVIRKFDLPETLFYLDPPYLHETRATTGEYGKYEMSRVDHAYLISALIVSKAKVMISGYHSDLYDKSFSSSRWTCHEFKVDNKASHAKKKEIKTEVLWTNY